MNYKEYEEKGKSFFDKCVNFGKDFIHITSKNLNIYFHELNEICKDNFSRKD
ncbi:hypothetical protein R4K89_13965 [Brachyspira intermedia]|uniref:hypothetical protein n=1 Tax=Brachyspira intermedia TaxID=84377 RepID=UPI003004DA15